LAVGGCAGGRVKGRGRKRGGGTKSGIFLARNSKEDGDSGGRSRQEKRGWGLRTFVDYLQEGEGRRKIYISYKKSNQHGGSGIRSSGGLMPPVAYGLERKQKKKKKPNKKSKKKINTSDLLQKKKKKKGIGVGGGVKKVGTCRMKVWRRAEKGVGGTSMPLSNRVDS